MGIEAVKAFFDQHAPDLQIIETKEPTPTVEHAAKVHGVQPGQIAKTLSLQVKDKYFLVVAAGDVRLDNKKLKDRFGGKAKMLDAESVKKYTGHPVGGVCPFGLATNLPVYCDQSLNEYDYVWPAAGAINSAVKITPARIAELTRAEWVDVTK